MMRWRQRVGSLPPALSGGGRARSSAYETVLLFQNFTQEPFVLFVNLTDP